MTWSTPSGRWPARIAFHRLAARDAYALVDAAEPFFFLLQARRVVAPDEHDRQLLGRP